LERFSFIFLVAGLMFFAVAFAVSGWIPTLSLQDLEIRTVEQMAQQPPASFIELQEQYPEAFENAFGNAPIEEAFAQALRLGHKTYVAEACWHCHSQQIRPWGNDEARYGAVSYPEEYHNELNMPPLWGTRRIGPDLIRRGGYQSNDWHVAHFYHPPDVNPVSVMPDYPWFYEADKLTPNKIGLSIIAYVQWLGSWQPTQSETVHSLHAIERAFPEPNIIDHGKPPAADESTPGAEDGYEDDGYEDDGYGDDEYGDDG
jgi:cbb3-type cytochrome c oxidase subunit II